MVTNPDEEKKEQKNDNDDVIELPDDEIELEDDEKKENNEKKQDLINPKKDTEIRVQFRKKKQVEVRSAYSVSDKLKDIEDASNADADAETRKKTRRTEIGSAYSPAKEAEKLTQPNSENKPRKPKTQTVSPYSVKSIQDEQLAAAKSKAEAKQQGSSYSIAQAASRLVEPTSEAKSKKKTETSSRYSIKDAAESITSKGEEKTAKEEQTSAYAVRDALGELAPQPDAEKRSEIAVEQASFPSLPDSEDEAKNAKTETLPKPDVHDLPAERPKYKDIVNIKTSDLPAARPKYSVKNRDSATAPPAVPAKLAPEKDAIADLLAGALDDEETDTEVKQNNIANRKEEDEEDDLDFLSSALQVKANAKSENDTSSADDSELPAKRPKYRNFAEDQKKEKQDAEE